jgi:acetyl-CoA acetyltransferase
VALLAQAWGRTPEEAFAPFGKFGTGLAGVRSDDLAAHVIREAVKHAPGLDIERIDEEVFGNACRASRH